MRLKTRECELSVFLDGLISLKGAAAYTTGDLYALIRLCSTNQFLAAIRMDTDIIASWKKTADHFFMNKTDRYMAHTFIDGYGKTDLEGQLSYIELFISRTEAALAASRRDVESKCKLYTILGLFSGTVMALIII